MTTKVDHLGRPRAAAAQRQGWPMANNERLMALHDPFFVFCPTSFVSSFVDTDVRAVLVCVQYVAKVSHSL